MNRLRGKLTYSNVMVTVLALIVLGGGTAYAATEMLPTNSVGAKQIKKEAVTPAKLSKASKAALTGPQGPAGPQGAKGDSGAKGDRGEPGPTTGPAGGALAGNYPNPTLATQPVVATGGSGSTVAIGTSCTHYTGAEVTINAPSSGSVTVSATAWLQFAHTTGKNDVAFVSLEESPTTCNSSGENDGAYSIPAALPTITGAQQVTVPVERTFPVTAGSHTYYLDGRKEIESTDAIQFWFAGLTATFIPS